jgi:hypothetical protein
MSAYDAICPLRNSSDKELVAMAREILPIEVYRGRAYLLNPGDIARNTFLGGSKKRIQIKNLKPVSTIETIHYAYVGDTAYMPRMAEVLLQTKDTVTKLNTQGIKVVAFENDPVLDLSDDPCYRLLEEKGKRSEWVHIGNTTLYSGTLPKGSVQDLLFVEGIVIIALLSNKTPNHLISPSPLMGEGRDGGEGDARTCLSSCFGITPTQPSPIEGEGFYVDNLAREP